MKKILSLLILSTLLLSGCNKQDAEVVNADTLLDQQIFEQAADSKDATLCETIKDEAMKTECAKVVEANLLKDEAIAEVDATECNKIQIERYKTNCVQTVAKIEADAKKAEAVKAQDDADMKLFNNATLALDVSACANVKDENYRKTCETEITVDMANKKNDSTLCDALKAADQVSTCKELFSPTK